MDGAASNKPAAKPADKKLFIKTFGCQMNVYDSQRMAEAMEAQGYSLTDKVEEADMALLNTCHIREKAAEKVYSELGRLKPHADAKRAAGGKLVIGVAGCVAQAEGAEIANRQKLVDLVVGPQAYHHLPELEARARAGERGLVEADFPVEDKFQALPKTAPRKRAPCAFLTVQEGCDKFCAFCVVPYTRGAEYSRPPEKIREEARALVDQGVREITLLGQNVNAYHGEGAGGAWSLARLIEALADIEGLARLRYTTSHPNDMSADLIAAHRDIPKLMPYLHLPVQSGSDAILKAMNRRHSARGYLDLIARIREARPDIALSGDFIVGFPGESDVDFDATMTLVREARYASAYSFKYSPRPGTPAAAAAPVEEAVKSERLARLQALLAEQQAAFQQESIGREMAVLLEKPGRKPGQLVGRSPYLQAVHLQANGAQIGDIVTARIIGAGANSLAGQSA